MRITEAHLKRIIRSVIAEVAEDEHNSKEIKTVETGWGLKIMFPDPYNDDKIPQFNKGLVRYLAEKGYELATDYEVEEDGILLRRDSKKYANLIDFQIDNIKKQMKILIP